MFQGLPFAHLGSLVFLLCVPGAPRPLPGAPVASPQVRFVRRVSARTGGVTYTKARNATCLNLASGERFPHLLYLVVARFANPRPCCARSWGRRRQRARLSAGPGEADTAPWPDRMLVTLRRLRLVAFKLGIAPHMTAGSLAPEYGVGTARRCTPCCTSMPLVALAVSTGPLTVPLTFLLTMRRGSEVLVPSVNGQPRGSDQSRSR